jgi:hypothetical protein
VRVSVIVITRFGIVISRFGHRDHESGGVGPDTSRLRSWSIGKSFLRGVVD